MTQRVKIAITGGIGSGKTAVSSLLREMGYPVLSCDEISRRLWGEEEYLGTLAENFPACTEEGKIDKAKLSALVFSDEEARLRLEAISHPRIMQELASEMEAFPVCFAEVPLLFEGGFEGLFDGVLLVERETKTRVAAVMARDGLTKEEVESRLLAQWTDERREERGAVVLKNDGSMEELSQKLRLALKEFGL